MSEHSDLIATVREALKEAEFDFISATHGLAALDALAAELERAMGLIRRFRQWDDLPARADGPYWMAEADRLLEGQSAAGVFLTREEAQRVRAALRFSPPTYAISDRDEVVAIVESALAARLSEATDG